MAHKDKIPVVEIFGPTIQGEGSLAGEQTLFIRVAACDYRCTLCDSMHAVLATPGKGATLMSTEEIVQGIVALDAAVGRGPESEITPWVTLSGGNPALWEFGEVVQRLQELGYMVAIETQGSIWSDWIATCDTITTSPKGPGMGIGKHKAIGDVNCFVRHIENAGVMRKLVFKVPIIEVQEDLVFVEVFMKLYPTVPMFLSVGNPWIDDNVVDWGTSMRDALLEKYEDIFNEVLKRPILSSAIILPQLHVLLWGNKKGV